MPKVNVVDVINHSSALRKELTGKGVAENTEVAIRETVNKITDEVLSKEASDAIKSRVSAQIQTPPAISAMQMEEARFKVADDIGSTIKNLGSAQNFVDIMLYRDLYSGLIALNHNAHIPDKSIDLAFEIIKKKYPKKQKDIATKLLSGKATEMKETEQSLISQLGVKKYSHWNIEKLLTFHRKEMAKYKKQAEKLVNSGKLESNPFT